MNAQAELLTGETPLVTSDRDVALVEVLDRALGAGVVISGELTISLADIDLVELSLRLLVGSVGTIRGGRSDEARSTTVALGPVERTSNASTTSSDCQ
jgi:Gas vesicle protein